MSNSAIPKDSRELLELAVRMLRADRSEMTADEVVLMVYHLGRGDGRLQQLDADRTMVREELGINAYAEAMLRSDQEMRQEGQPHHDQNTRGDPLKPGR
jgi:hypothetical protein